MTCRGTQRWQRLRNDEAVFASIFGSNLALARYPWIAHFFWPVVFLVGSARHLAADVVVGADCSACCCT